MSKKFFLTTAIPYVNANPHAGHALEYVMADVINRYHKLIGDEVFFVSGADENALKNVQAAEKAGMKPDEPDNMPKFSRFLFAPRGDLMNSPWTDSSAPLMGVGVVKLAEKNGDTTRKI